MSKTTIEHISDDYTAQELFMDNELHCCLCGQDMKFEHHVDFTENKIAEKAECGHCHVKRPATEHSLH